jgi:NAD(P)-dependent dehydrogenase (short-subunit alcohol dehydrogenase family)
MTGPLSGKIALVTGASQGTGRAYARALAQAGAIVVASSRSMKIPKPGAAPLPSSLASLAQEAGAAGERIHVVACNVGVEDEIVRCVDEILANFGRIDIVVNNAATYPEDQPVPHYDPFGFTTEEWEHYMRVNVVGPYHTIRTAAPHMIARRSGSIINITSGAALGVDFKAAQVGMLAYVTSKAALNRMTQFFALELQEHNIAVNALCPGMVITNSWRGITDDMRQEMLQSGRAKPPTPEAMGPALLFLAQQTGETYTGKILSTDEYGTSWP